MSILSLCGLTWLCLVPLVSVHGTLFDLTFTIDNSSLKFPGVGGYSIVPIVTREFYNVKWMLYEEYTAITHVGTHIDAPRHFNKRGTSVDKIPLDHLIVPGVFIDIRYKSLNNPDSLITVQDVENWESNYGEIPRGAGVFQCSGWYAYYPNPALYYGNDRQNIYDFHYPSFSLEAVKWLVQKRGIFGIGVDTPTIDYGQSHDFPVHNYAAKKDIYGLEMMGDNCSVPPSGSTVYVFPMKMRDGSGGPTRVIAQWND